MIAEEDEYFVEGLLDPDCEETLYKMEQKEKQKNKSPQIPRNLLHILLPTTTLGLLPETK